MLLQLTNGFHTLDSRSALVISQDTAYTKSCVLACNRFTILKPQKQTT